MLSTKLPFNLMLTQWASQLNPLLSNPILQGSLLQDVSLTSGNTVINHKLGRLQVGWFIVDQNAAAEIYRTQPLNSQTLTLNSSAACTISLWVF